MHKRIDEGRGKWQDGDHMTRRDSKRTRTPKKRLESHAEQGVNAAQELMRRVIAKADPGSVKRKG